MHLQAITGHFTYLVYVGAASLCSITTVPIGDRMGHFVSWRCLNNTCVRRARRWDRRERDTHSSYHFSLPHMHERKQNLLGKERGGAFLSSSLPFARSSLSSGSQWGGREMSTVRKSISILVSLLLSSLRPFSPLKRAWHSERKLLLRMYSTQ